MKKQVYAEIGVGNKTFLSTEIEKGKKETRLPKFISPEKVISFYFRFWIFKKILIIDTKEGFKLMNKDKNKLKILFGVHGISQNL